MYLKDKFTKEAVPVMMKEFGYKSVSAVPKIEKVVVNTGFGKLVIDKTSDERKKIQTEISDNLALICGQRPVLTRAKKSVAGFKLRQGLAVGAMATLRGRKMYDFLERLIDIYLPRTRDFQGIDPKSFDKKGNLTIAVKEHFIFPEISPEKSRIIFGIEITVVTTAKDNNEGLKLLKLIGFPIKS
ncbi:MAG: 50S ribosomal protein L5 [Candidatus Pacebacteria bacterium]|nr:50S ribosomal protein L5 [Candidatus Paceibacterota bacterium]